MLPGQCGKARTQENRRIRDNEGHASARTETGRRLPVKHASPTPDPPFSTGKEGRLMLTLPLELLQGLESLPPQAPVAELGRQGQ